MNRPNPVVDVLAGFNTSPRNVPDREGGVGDRPVLQVAISLWVNCRSTCVWQGACGRKGSDQVNGTVLEQHRHRRPYAQDPCSGRVLVGPSIEMETLIVFARGGI